RVPCSGGDRLVSRGALLDGARDDQALARFDELTGGPAVPAAPSHVTGKRARRIRPNAVTANQARTDAAIAARDADALPALISDDTEILYHPTGAVYGRDGLLASWRAIMRVPDYTFRHEPLAALGDSLALFHQSVSASGVARGNFDIGNYEMDRVLLSEVDAQGRRSRAELFAIERLGDAVARLYERYAELLPDGPERARAAATAHSVAAMVGPVDPDRLASACAPAVEVVDHRMLGTWSARGAEAVRQHNRCLLEVADQVALREDDILALRPDAFLVRRSHLGSDRASGGPYERLFLQLWVFGADGLATHIEYFDPDRDDEALARFDELTAAPSRAA